MQSDEQCVLHIDDVLAEDSHRFLRSRAEGFESRHFHEAESEAAEDEDAMVCDTAFFFRGFDLSHSF